MIYTIEFKNSKNLESLKIIWVSKSEKTLKNEKTFRMKVHAEFRCESPISISK